MLIALRCCRLLGCLRLFEFTELLFILRGFRNLQDEGEVLLSGSAPLAVHIDGKCQDEQRHNSYGNADGRHNVVLCTLLYNLALFALGVIDSGKFGRLAALLADEGRIIDFGNLHGYAQGCVLATGKVVGAELGQQIESDGLQVVFVAPLFDKAIQLGVVVGGLSIASCSYQVFATVDTPFECLSIVASRIVGIVACCISPFSMHLADLGAVQRYQCA